MASYLGMPGFHAARTRSCHRAEAPVVEVVDVTMTEPAAAAAVPVVVVVVVAVAAVVATAAAPLP